MSAPLLLTDVQPHPATRTWSPSFVGMFCSVPTWMLSFSGIGSSICGGTELQCLHSYQKNVMNYYSPREILSLQTGLGSAYLSLSLLKARVAYLDERNVVREVSILVVVLMNLVAPDVDSDAVSGREVRRSRQDAHRLRVHPSEKKSLS